MLAKNIKMKPCHFYGNRYLFSCEYAIITKFSRLWNMRGILLGQRICSIPQRLIIFFSPIFQAKLSSFVKVKRAHAH